MINKLFALFSSIWLADFEFGAAPGERPAPICMVARELHTGRIIRLWADDLRRLPAAPFALDEKTLVIAYYASAELGCFLSLDWRLPCNVLDLFTEFRALTNGLTLQSGAGLLGALIHFGLDAMDAAEKDEMRDLALRGPPYAEAEKVALLAYCESDVTALEKLLTAMLPHLDLERALLRGRFMKAAAQIEYTGVPVDVPTLRRLTSKWESIQDELIRRVDADYGVFDGHTFKADRFDKYLASLGLSWPRHPSGSLVLDDDTFKEMARAYPQLGPLRELRVSLSQMRLADLAVGADGRNRCILSAFRARTGRNQPSNSKFIFGPAVWLRGLIRPPEGRGLAYVDWEQQEFGIAAALSRDAAMQNAYNSGDPYLAFAVLAGAGPKGATKATHGAVRELYKACALAVQYGMGADGLAERIGSVPAHARELLLKHHETFPDFWRWSDSAVDFAALYGSIHTVFGWRVRLGEKLNPRSVRNFPMQANGAEMLRLACSYATEAGITICAPVHDAVLIEAPLEDLEHRVEQMQAHMARASRDVLGGFELRADAKLIRHPDRYADPRGARMWSTVMELLDDCT